MDRYLPDPRATENLGSELAALCRAGNRIYLDGELGSGKTTLVRGFLRSLGCDDPVRSPTYTLVENYPTASFPVVHFDLYRLRSPRELETMGTRDYFDGTGVCIVEWPDRGAGFLPEPDIIVHLEHADDGRTARLHAGTVAGEDLLAVLSHSHAS